MNQPKPDPSEEGSGHSLALRKFPSSEGLGSGSCSKAMFDRASSLAPIARFFGHSSFPFWTVTVAALLAIVALLSTGFPALDHTANALRPRHSPAYATLEEIKVRMSRPQEPAWLLIAGQNEGQVARRLESTQPILQRAASNQQIASFTLPTALWPRPEFQSLNRIIAQQLEAERESVRAAAQAHGFAGNELAFTDGVFNVWRQATV